MLEDSPSCAGESLHALASENQMAAAIVRTLYDLPDSEAEAFDEIALLALANR